MMMVVSGEQNTDKKWLYNVNNCIYLLKYCTSRYPEISMMVSEQKKNLLGNVDDVRAVECGQKGIQKPSIFVVCNSTPIITLSSQIRYCIERNFRVIR